MPRFLKILFIILMQGALGLPAFAFETSDSNINYIHKNLSELRNEAQFFSRVNKAFLEGALQCLEHIQNNAQKLSQDPICQKHINYFQQMRERSFPVYRLYKAIHSLNFLHFRHKQGHHAFTDAGISTLINLKIEHFSYKLPLLFSEVHRTKMEPLNQTEVQYLHGLLKKNIKNACLAFIESDKVKPIWSSSGQKYKDSFCNNLHLVDFGVEQFRNQQIAHPDLQMLYQIRSDFQKFFIEEKLEALADKASSIFENELHGSPALIFVRSHATFFEDLKTAYTIMLENNHEQEKHFNFGQPANLNSTKQQKISEIKQYSSLLAFDFLVKNKLMALAASGGKEESQVFNQFVSSWRNREENEQLAITGLMIAGTVSCFFLPKAKLVAMLTARSLCLFSVNQPLSVFMAINTADQLNRIYSLYLMASDGNTRLVDFDSIENKLVEHYLSLLVLPLGTTESLGVFNTISRLLK